MPRYAYQSHFVDGNGTVVPSGTITVYLSGTSTLATIYESATGPATSSSQLTSDSNDGSFKFFVDTKDYAASQQFKISLSKTNFRTQTYENIVVFPDQTYRYVVDANEADQGATGNGFSLKALVDDIGSNNETIYFPPGAYTLTTSETVPSNITLKIERGAVLDGAGTLTLGSIPEAGNYAIFGSSITVAIGDYFPRFFKWFATSSQAVGAMVRGVDLKVLGSFDIATYGVISSTIPFNIIGSSAVDINENGYGSALINDSTGTVDSPVIKFITTNREEKILIDNIFIHHEGATSYAIEIENIIRSEIRNCYLWMNTAGYGGVKYDDEAFFARIAGTRVRNFTDYGVYIDGSGSEHVLIDSHVSSTEDNATGVYTTRQGTHIVRGQYAMTGTGSIPIHFYNEHLTNTFSGGFIDCPLIENTPSGEYAIVIDGDSPFEEINIVGLRAGLSNNEGTLVKFGNAQYCSIVDPQVFDTSGAGYLAEFTADSSQCRIECDYLNSVANITVSGSAVNPQMTVKGEILRSNVTNITTAANFRVTLSDGVDDLSSGFVPVHNGTAWDYATASLGDETATSFSPPADYGKVKVLTTDGTNIMGEVYYDTSSGAIVSVGGGADFETGTSALLGTTGSNAKVTLAAVNDGKLYFENQIGAGTKTFIFLIEPVEY